MHVKIPYILRPDIMIHLNMLRMCGMDEANKQQYLLNLEIPEILFMEEILHHLGCIKPCKE